MNSDEFSKHKLKDYRCALDNSLLCRAAGDGEIEIKNHKNRYMNYVGPSRKTRDGGLMGLDFSAGSTDLRCKKCGGLLGRVRGTYLFVEIKCPHGKCSGELNFFDIEAMKQQRMRAINNVALQKGIKDKTI